MIVVGKNYRDEETLDCVPAEVASVTDVPELTDAKTYTVPLITMSPVQPVLNAVPETQVTAVPLVLTTPLPEKPPDRARSHIGTLFVQLSYFFPLVSTFVGPSRRTLAEL